MDADRFCSSFVNVFLCVVLLQILCFDAQHELVWSLNWTGAAQLTGVFCMQVCPH